MKIRVASLLLALALPLTAQEPAADQTEAIFYKAFYLEKGQRDFAGAMALYEQFLAKAPDSKLAGAAAKQQYSLLDATGKTKERDAFKAKYEKLLGNVANAPAPGGAPGGGAGDRPGRGDGEGRAGGGGRPDAQARIAELEKQLEKAKADGKEEDVKRLQAELERARAGGRGPGAGGAGGRGPGGAGMMALFGQKKIADMNDEEIKGLKDSLAQSSQMVERRKERDPEGAEKLAKSIEDLKKALDANKKEDAQKALDAIRESMPRGRRGGGGDAGGGAGGGGNRGGGGGNNGGGGGNNGGGGGGGR